MKVTTPDEMYIDTSEFGRSIESFELLLKKQLKGESIYSIAIPGSLREETRRDIEKIYHNAGWTGVSCISTPPGSGYSYTELLLKR